jgi:hypothetical protein
MAISSYGISKEEWEYRKYMQQANRNHYLDPYGGVGSGEVTQKVVATPDTKPAHMNKKLLLLKGAMK